MKSSELTTQIESTKRENDDDEAAEEVGEFGSL